LFLFELTEPQKRFFYLAYVLRALKIVRNGGKAAKHLFEQFRSSGKRAEAFF